MAESIAEWFPVFYDNHSKRLKRNDFPKFSLQDPFVSGWISAFISHGITKEEADLASIAVQANPPVTLTLQLNAVIEEARKIRESRDATASAEFTNCREQAKSQSWDCPECDGEGFAVRHFVIPERYGTMKFRGTLFCRCSLGRFIESHYREHHPHFWAAIDDLQSHPELWRSDLRHRTWSCNPSDIKPPQLTEMSSSYWCET